MLFKIGDSAATGFTLVTLTLVAACTAQLGSTPLEGNGAGGSGQGGSAVNPGAGTTSAGGSDLPCDVQAFLASKCQVCHKVSPPGALLSAADFARPSTTDPSLSVGKVALARLSATDTTHMPPAPLAAATPAEVTALTNWINAGASAASCGQATPVGPDPYATPVVCTSMTNWTGGNRESPQMRPGGACISCHERGGEGPLFAVAGTLYPTAHEPDDCNGASSASAAGAQVIITDGNGMVQTLTPNSAGNFFFESASFSYPYTAKVTYQGRERAMLVSQKDGDCNSCHTQAGDQMAPGRIFLP
jgi:hypothetical protein